MAQSAVLAGELSRYITAIVRDSAQLAQQVRSGNDQQ
jgi:hypothetical protein